MSKLIMPLFHNGNFNRDGKKVRAEFIREVGDGNTSYRLWRCECESGRDFPHAENDKYFLHIETNGYLVPLGQTEYSLIDACGRKAACEELYGGEEGRKKFYDGLRTQYNATDNYTPFKQAAEREEEVIDRIGNDPAKWVKHIGDFFRMHIEIYSRSVENDGDTFPDFVGAVVLNDLSTCLKLRAKYQKKAEIREQAERERKKAEDTAFCEEQNRIAEEQVRKAISVLRDGGTLENNRITLYKTRYDSEDICIVNYLARRYHINVPIRTKGWISDKLMAFIIATDGQHKMRCRNVKGSKGSTRISTVLADLINAAKAESA